MQSDEDTLLTVLEAAAYLRVHPSTLARWRSFEQVTGPEFLRSGKKIMYRKRVLDEWLALPGSKIGA